MALIELKKTTIKIIDGDSPKNEITVKVGEGNMTYSITREIEYVLDRGVIDEVREGDQVPVEVSLDVAYEFYTSDSAGGEPVTPIEALTQTGEASTWVSSDADTCRPYSVDIEVLYEPGCAPTKNEKYIFKDFRYESIEPDFGEATIAVSGSANQIFPTVTRETPP